MGHCGGFPPLGDVRLREVEHWLAGTQFHRGTASILFDETIGVSHLLGRERL